jgi:hypothetical protein
MKEMECSELVNDELEALRGIYCGPGEFQLLSGCETEKVFVVKVHTTRGTPIQVTFNLKHDYPLVAPHFSVQVASCLSIHKSHKLKRLLLGTSSETIRVVLPGIEVKNGSRTTEGRSHDSFSSQLAYRASNKLGS